MWHTPRSFEGMVTSPHHLASQAGARVLREGGDAIEAAVATAATMAVAYPHMCGLGGDCFILVHEPGQPPRGIEACGGAGARASVDFYRALGLDAIPERGPLAALTVAGVPAGWSRALELSRSRWGGRLPLARLLDEAIHHAREGIAVTDSQHLATTDKREELEAQPGFARSFLPRGRPPPPGERFRQPRLGDTLEWLGREGLEDFYRGELARSLAHDLERAGAPLALEDLERHRARDVTPLCLEIGGHRLYNLPPPTQGFASLLLLGIYERLGPARDECPEWAHSLIEATKAAFRLRDRYLGDPDVMTRDVLDFLAPPAIDALARGIDRTHASPWPSPSAGGDTVWLGAVDAQGRAVSLIQSLYWEFGSGTVLEDSGVCWQNRGVVFRLDDTVPRGLAPGRRPAHTIQPALAHLTDGRVMVYGTMGGDGQPQTQAMVFTRHALFGQDLQRAVTAPRWLLGRTWGSNRTSLRIESRFDSGFIEALRTAGHPVEVIGEFDEVMGHAGALVHHPGGLVEGAADPRSDGCAAAP